MNIAQQRVLYCIRIITEKKTHTHTCARTPPPKPTTHPDPTHTHPLTRTKPHYISINRLSKPLKYTHKGRHQTAVTYTAQAKVEGNRSRGESHPIRFQDKYHRTQQSTTTLRFDVDINLQVEISGKRSECRNAETQRRNDYVS